MEQTREQRIADEIEAATDTDLQANQAAALVAYDAVPGAQPKGWSTLVSSDVRDAVESAVAEIMGAVNTDEPIAIFDPTSQEDEQKAEIETWAVHQAIFGRNRGAVVLEHAIRDMLLQRYGVIKVWVETITKSESKAFEDIGADVLGELLMREEDGVTYDIQGAMKVTDGGGYDVTVKRTQTSRHLRVEPVAPENLIWSKDLRTPYLGDARFFAERCYYSRDELDVMKASGVEDLPTGTASDDVSIARYPSQGAQSVTGDEGADEIECYWSWSKNYEKGGFDCALFVMPGEIIKSYWRPFHPYACGVATLRPHRFDGVSLYDRIGPIQETKTYLLRQLATQARLTNQTRLVVRDRTAEPDDVTSEALNPVIRVSGIPGECIMPLPVLDITSQLLATMQWIDGLRREAGGASIDMTSPELQIAGQSAHAAEREYSFRELGALAMLRTIGDTLVRSLALLTHAVIKEELTGPMDVRKGGNWMNLDPQQWPARMSVSVDIGQPLGVRSRRQAALMATIQMQAQTMQAGGAGLLVNLADIYKAQVDLGKLSGLREAASYWTDPSSQESVQKAQGQAQAAQQQGQAQMQLQQQTIQAAYAIEQLKSETDILRERMSSTNERLIARMDNQQKYFDAILQAMTKGVEIDAADRQRLEEFSIDSTGTDGDAGTMEDDSV